MTTIFEKQSVHQRICVVDNDKNQRVMMFDDEVRAQSLIDHDSPNALAAIYTQYCMLGLCVAPSPVGRTLVLGLGGGCMPRFLRRHFPEMYIDVVELDVDVLLIAKEHFAFKTDAKMVAHIQDAREFLQQDSSVYDFIIVDVFSNGQIPRHLTSQKFYAQLAARLSPQGVLAVNTFALASNLNLFSEIRTIQSQFPQLALYQVLDRGNNIILASKAGDLETSSMVQRAIELLNAKPEFDVSYHSMLQQRLPLEVLQKEIDRAPLIED